MMQTLKKITFLSLGLSTLFLLAGCSNSEGYSISGSSDAGWYMKTAVYATADDGKVYDHTTAGVFGELVQSEDGRDRHDVPGYGSAILQVVFTPGWSDDYYFSDYHAYDASDSSKKSWTFQVKNQNTVDLSNAPIRIALDGMYKVTYEETANGGIKYTSKKSASGLTDNITLVDIDNHQAYTAAQLQGAGLNMNGLHTRTFRWIIGDVSEEDYLPLALPSAAKRASPAGPTSSDFTETETDRASTPVPPSF